MRTPPNRWLRVHPIAGSLLVWIGATPAGEGWRESKDRCRIALASRSFGLDDHEDEALAGGLEVEVVLDGDEARRLDLDGWVGTAGVGFAS